MVLATKRLQRGKKMKAIYIDWTALNELLTEECGGWTEWITMMDENGNRLGRFSWTSDFEDEDAPRFCFKIFSDDGEDPEEIDRCRLEDFACGGGIFFQRAHYSEQSEDQPYKRAKPVLAILPFININNLP